MLILQKRYFFKNIKETPHNFTMWIKLVYGRVAISNLCNSVSTKINILNAALPI
jgi:hypothetical protein